MANDLSDTVRDALGSMVREAIKNVGDASPSKSGGGGSPFSGAKGLAAGAGLAAAAPLAKKGFDAVRGNGGLPTPSPARAAKKVASKASPRTPSQRQRRRLATRSVRISRTPYRTRSTRPAAPAAWSRRPRAACFPASAAATAAERAVCQELEKAGGCRCSRRSTWPCRARPPTTSSPSSRTGRSSCIASRA